MSRMCVIVLVYISFPSFSKQQHEIAKTCFVKRNHDRAFFKFPFLILLCIPYSVLNMVLRCSWRRCRGYFIPTVLLKLEAQNEIFRS